MSINERIVELRKALKLSQRKFCVKIGLHQATFDMLEKPGQDVREVYIKVISKVYNVSEEWLRSGTGEMFVEAPDGQLEELIDIYDSLPPSLQQFLYKQAKELQNLQGEVNC